MLTKKFDKLIKIHLNKCCSFELSIHQNILKKNYNFGFHKIINY